MLHVMLRVMLPAMFPKFCNIRNIGCNIIGKVTCKLHLVTEHYDKLTFHDVTLHRRNFGPKT